MLQGRLARATAFCVCRENNGCARRDLRFSPTPVRACGPTAFA